MPDDSQAFSDTGGDAAAFTAPPDPRARLEELLASEFINKAHVDPTQAQLQAKWLVDSAAISARIASHAPIPDRLDAFKNLFAERALEESFAEMPTPTAKAAAHDILMAENLYNYQSLYQAAQDVPPPPLSQPNELHPFVSYVFETGSGKFKNEAGRLAIQKFAGTEAGKKVVEHATKVLGKEAVTKFLTQAGVKAATTAATAGGGAAAGAEAGAAAGSPGGPLAIVTAIVGAAVGFVLGAVVGNWSKAKHEAQEGILALSAAVYTIGSSIFSGGVAAVGAIFAAIGTVAVESATSIVVIVLAIPIVVAFMLYIISNSAYLVPPSSTVFVPGPGGGFQNRSGCPIANGYISTGSYDSQTEKGHGSNSYWGSAANSCFRHIPADGISCGPTVDINNDNYCSNTANWDNSTCNASDPSDIKTSYYGYAIDVFSRSGTTAYAPVSFPLINGQVTTWNYVREIGMPADRSAGWAYLYTTTGPGTGVRYDVAFIHLTQISSPPTVSSSGQILGYVYPNVGHLHLELQVDGVYAKPEGFFCNGSIVPQPSQSPQLCSGFPLGNPLDWSGQGITTRLLPPASRLNYCIKPTTIVMHWSGGWTGVDGTFNNFVTDKQSCQFATDENTTLQMTPIWENGVEMAKSCSYIDDVAIGIEMAGTCFSTSLSGPCSPVIPPPPTELQRTIDLVCLLRTQYGINTIKGHYQTQPGKIDPGEEFFQNTFLPRVVSQCGPVNTGP